jgi:hypothetical protein
MGTKGSPVERRFPLKTQERKMKELLQLMAAAAAAAIAARAGNDIYDAVAGGKK